MRYRCSALICLNDELAAEDRRRRAGVVIGPRPCRVSVSRKEHIALTPACSQGAATCRIPKPDVDLSSEKSACAAFRRAGRGQSAPGLGRPRHSQQYSQSPIQGRIRPCQPALSRDRRRCDRRQPRQTAFCAGTRCPHRAGPHDPRPDRRGRPARRGGRGHRQRRARPWAGFAGGCGGARRAKIRHAADRPELPGHHDARRQSQCELFRAYAGGGKSGADLAVGRHCRGHGGLGGAAGRRLFRHCLDRRPARCRYRRSARLLRAGRKDPGHPALHRGDQGRPQVHVGGARRRQDQAGRGRQIRPDGARRAGRCDPYRRAGRG